MNAIDALFYISIGSAATFFFCMFVTRNEHREWSQLTDHLIALIEKQQMELDDADWWKNNGNEKVDNEN